MKINLGKFTTAFVRSIMDMNLVSHPVSQVQSNCWCFDFFFNSATSFYIKCKYDRGGKTHVSRIV